MGKIILNRPATIHRALPANYSEEDFIFIRDHASYSTYECYMKEYNNVLVSPDSVIYKNFSLQKDSLASPNYQKYYGFRHLVKKFFFHKRRNLDQGDYLLVTDSWSPGHFHWLCDVLPKLWRIREKTGKYILLLPDTPYIRRIAIPSMEMLDLKFRDIHLMKDKEFYRVKNLQFISRISRSGTVDDSIMKELNNKFREGRKVIPQRRIYISRENARIRKVLNEPELISALKGFNFEIINSEDFSLEDQVSMFNSCEVLVSIHGSGLTNTLFMPPGSKVVEFRKKEAPGNQCYWHLAGSLDIPYYYYFGIPDSDKPLEGNGCNLTIPIKDFESKMAAWLAVKSTDQFPVKNKII